MSLNKLDGPSLAKVNLFYEIATLNGSLLTVDDLADLLSAEADVERLRNVLESSRELGYGTVSGYILKAGDNLEPEEMLRRREMAAEYVSAALNVSRVIRGAGAQLIAVSGSTSYGSVGPLDDLDFFCVTSECCAWLFITRSLLILRIMRTFSHSFGRVCLSCVMDEGYAKSVFRKPQGALFSRDALTTVVLYGAGFYTKLLQVGGWMREFFPRIYDRRAGLNTTPMECPRASLMKRLANAYLYQIVGKYILLKSYIENRKMARLRRPGRAFAARLGEDHCIFESERYTKMKRMYDTVYAEGAGLLAQA